MRDIGEATIRNITVRASRLRRITFVTFMNGFLTGSSSALTSPKLRDLYPAKDKQKLKELRVPTTMFISRVQTARGRRSLSIISRMALSCLHAGATGRGRPQDFAFCGQGLREQAYAVDVAASGDDALYQAAINNYDLVILDIMIPGTDGFGVCRSCARRGSAFRS